METMGISRTVSPVGLPRNKEDAMKILAMLRNLSEEDLKLVLQKVTEMQKEMGE